MRATVLADLSHVGFELVASIASVCSCGIDDNSCGVPSKQCEEEKRLFQQHAFAKRSKRKDESLSLPLGSVSVGGVNEESMNTARKESGAMVLWRC